MTLRARVINLPLNAAGRAQVDRVRSVLRELHGDIIDAPAEHDYNPAYYAVLFRDPDAFKLEVVHVPLRAADPTCAGRRVGASQPPSRPSNAARTEFDAARPPGEPLRRDSPGVLRLTKEQ